MLLIISRQFAEQRFHPASCSENLSASLLRNSSLSASGPRQAPQTLRQSAGFLNSEIETADPNPRRAAANFRALVTRKYLLCPWLIRFPRTPGFLSGVACSPRVSGLATGHVISAAAGHVVSRQCLASLKTDDERAKLRFDIKASSVKETAAESTSPIFAWLDEFSSENEFCLHL